MEAVGAGVTQQPQGPGRVWQAEGTAQVQAGGLRGHGHSESGVWLPGPEWCQWERGGQRPAARSRWLWPWPRLSTWGFHLSGSHSSLCLWLRVTQAWKGRSAHRGRAGSQPSAWPRHTGPSPLLCLSLRVCLTWQAWAPHRCQGPLCSWLLSGVSRAPAGPAVLSCPFAHVRHLGRPLPVGPVLQDRPALLLGCLVSLVFFSHENI